MNIPIVSARRRQRACPHRDRTVSWLQSRLADAGDPTVVGIDDLPTGPHRDRHGRFSRYCRWCGNGYWKRHAPVCAWADHHETEHPYR